MGLIQYKTDEFGRKTFNIAQAIKDHWNIDYTNRSDIEGLKLKDRREPKLKAEIRRVFWAIGTLSVEFKKGGWLALDHAIEQFEPI